MVQLRHLRYFVATAEEGTVTAAAAAVSVTQPALSRQLRQLEHDLGVSLFERSAGRLTISRAGATLLPMAREVLTAAESLRSSAAFLAAGRIERITIAAPTVTLTEIVSPFVATTNPDEPVFAVIAADGLSAEQMLKSGADLALSSRRAPHPYQSRSLVELPVWAYVRPTDLWCKRASIDVSELVERPIIGMPPSYGAREALDTAVAASGCDFSGFVEAESGAVAQALAATGRGIAVVTDDPRYDLVPLRIAVGRKQVVLRLYASWDGHTMGKQVVASMAARLSEWASRRYGV